MNCLLPILFLCFAIVHPGLAKKRTTWDNGCEIDLSKKIVCYYTNWAQYRPGIGAYTVDNIDPCLCTHIVYAFANINETEVITSEANDREMFAKLRAMRDINWDLKLLISVGGARLGAHPFINIVSTETKRKKFAKSVLRFLRNHRLDGIDVDWEYPSTIHKDNYTLMLREIKTTLQSENDGTGTKQLAVALGGGRSFVDFSYDIPAISQIIDFANIMSYDLWGAWFNRTGFHSGLYGWREVDELCQEWIVKRYLELGLPREKLVLGIPTYGRTFTLYNESQYRPLDTAYESGKSGPQTQISGVLSYYEICRKPHLKDEYDERQQAPYSYHEDFWVGYDNVHSIQQKKQFIENNSLGGVMFWDLSQDDFSDQCGGGSYPLIRVFDPNSAQSVHIWSYTISWSCVITCLVVSWLK